jgi:L-2-hydroxyglutarate oxidase
LGVTDEFRVAVIGGGIVGLATARALLQAREDLTVVVLEKEAAPGRHQSTHNSGVLHCGLYYQPGSLKAQLAVSGIRMMTEFCEAEDIPHEICGKVVVATEARELERLKALHKRGQENGLQGLRWLSGEELREIEPHAAGVAALHVPQEGIVDYDSVCQAMLRHIIKCGGHFVGGAKVVSLDSDGAGWRIGTSAGVFRAGTIVNCAGLFCDRVAELAGVERTTRIVPFRGEYFRLSAEGQQLVRHLIYPVPDPEFPFLGVHFTRLIHGGIEAGPNAVLAWAREGYRKTDFRVGDMADAMLFPGLWAFMRRYPRMVWEESVRSMSRELFANSLRRLVPALETRHLSPGGAGVRAQAMSPDGTLVQDFMLVKKPRALHVLNAPSPAATASLAIGQHLAQHHLLTDLLAA